MVRHDKNSDDGIFLYDSQTHAFMPITHTGTADYNNFSITGDGERIVFASRLDPYGSLASMPTEYFYSTRTLIKYTRIIGARPDPNGVYSFAQFNSASTSTNGRRIAFLSIADLVGNSNDGNFEIFLLDLRDKACTQITDTTDKSYFGSHSRAFLNLMARTWLLDPRLNSPGTTPTAIGRSSYSTSSPTRLPRLRTRSEAITPAPRSPPTALALRLCRRRTRPGAIYTIKWRFSWRTARLRPRLHQPLALIRKP